MLPARALSDAMFVFVCLLSGLGMSIGCSDQNTDSSSPPAPDSTRALPDPGPPPVEPQQGINGRVVKLVGDFTLDPPRGESVPQAAPVHLFRGRLLPIDEPDPEHPQFVQIVQPDEQGRFKIPLPPGEYTLVAEIDGFLYLNNADAEGNWTTVVVKPDIWTEFTIENVLEATF